jgi:hypothetical protein
MILLLSLLISACQAMDIYTIPHVVPLSYTKVVANAPVSGLSVTVKVVNAVTNATLLSSTPAPEVATGAGVYTYNWTSGLTADTLCQVTYTVGSTTVYKEFIYITLGAFGARGT